MDSTTAHNERQQAYPRSLPDDRYFAHRFVRLLTKAAVANELGPEVCWLLAVVAMQEDSKRYTGAVTYWNEQLMPLCGFGSRKRLVVARQRAIESGWLIYEQGGKGRPGKYFVAIPERFASLPDGPCDESDAVCRSDSERKTERKTKCRSESERKAERKRGAMRNGKGAPFLPVPIPAPLRAGARKAASAKFVPPTADDVRRFAEEQSLSIDPDAFIDHYESVGWKIGGRSPMKDWRAAARGWARRQKEFTRGTSGNGAGNRGRVRDADRYSFLEGNQNGKP